MSSQLLGRTPEGIQLVTVGQRAAQELCTPGSAIMCTADGSRLVHSGQGCVRLIDLDAAQQVVELKEDGVVLSALSSTGAFLVTCQRPTKAGEGPPAQNLKVWDLASGLCVFSMVQKQVNKDHWPVLHWTHDDESFIHMVTNTIHVYSRSDGFSAYRKVAIKGIGGVALSPVPRGGSVQVVAAFLPEVKAAPAATGIYALDVPEPQPTVRKSFFRTQGANMLWNSLGSACLVMSYADFDATNQSYYGEQKLHFLPADPARADDAVTVPLPKEGPVHDVQWSPTGDCFIAIAGFMPAKVTLFNSSCKPVYDLGSGPYNMVRWNPFGRFFAITGFGNLPGDIVFYEYGGVAFSLARDDDDDKPGKIKAGARVRLPPGADFVNTSGSNKAASKNAKRRSKKKDGEDDGRDATEEAVAEVAEAVASTSLEAPQPAAAVPDSEEARQKRVRALQKKQRQIQELKDKLAQGGKALTPEQQEKLAGEQAILQELASLGATVTSGTRQSDGQEVGGLKQQVSASAVEDANRKFYDAFMSGRIEEMDKIIGEGEHVQIVHPGAGCIAGREQVMESWRTVLRGVRPGAFKVKLEDVRVYAREDAGFVTCVEVIDADDSTGRIVATNIFEKQGGVWRIVQHHGSPPIARFR
ncbi:Eukaryotic translation initiation factor 2A [Tetrabaena socialis]|uniref:Eukaryotic translation initiation factor 2A n=1 Tax=Tetrabaena socialis TaxID=47790 RepID=A0A2J8A6E9_9CHLO|nr:Eukaryotic translation initiation factor 2A [Tetrabaena socialis]|eukprot:PNH08063.1 Eukaryotic translation initiation factor 2A [Tetrabaena socialis]